MTETSVLPEVGPEVIRLPRPMPRGGMSLAEALAHRRSRREFGDRDPSLSEVGQLCWAGQGITDWESGLRAAPSIGATYPLMLYIAAPAGVYRYEPTGNRLHRTLADDVRWRLQHAARDQQWVGDAPICLVIAANPTIVVARYGRRRGWRYAIMEAGHVAENILLQATALDLAAVSVGSFDDRQAADILGLPQRVRPVYLIPVGSMPDA